MVEREPVLRQCLMPRLCGHIRTDMPVMCTATASSSCQWLPQLLALAAVALAVPALAAPTLSAAAAAPPSLEEMGGAWIDLTKPVSAHVRGRALALPCVDLPVAGLWPGFRPDDSLRE